MLKEFFYASKITKIKNRECSPNSTCRMMDFTNLFAKYFANTFLEAHVSEIRPMLRENILMFLCRCALNWF